jgi:hypothetical protein
VERSVAANCGRDASRSIIAGTANIEVTPRSAIVARTRSASKPGWMMIVPPLRKVGIVVMLSPATWNSGAIDSVTSVDSTSMSMRTLTYWVMSEPCVCVAPFGRPVVPEVYMIIAASSAPISSSISSVLAPAMLASYPRTTPELTSTGSPARTGGVPAAPAPSSGRFSTGRSSTCNQVSTDSRWPIARTCSWWSVPKTTARAPELARMYSTSGAARRALMMTQMAPSCAVAKNVSSSVWWLKPT